MTKDLPNHGALVSVLKRLAMFLIAVLSCASTQARVNARVETLPYRRAEVLQLAEKVADYQFGTLAAGYVPPNTSRDTPDPKGWVQAAFFVGLTALAERSPKPTYRAAIIARGLANEWQLGERTYHADDHSIGSVYLWAARNGAGSGAIQPLQSRFDTILRFPPTADLQHADYGDPRGVACAQRWCWSDALFMAPPVWLELARTTGKHQYSDYAKQELVAATDYLYDKAEHLYFRDSRFFDRRGVDGEKVFWSRGNGWAFSGLARSIPLLPENDPTRVRMESVFKEMAATLKAAQKPDGYWSPSLLARTPSPPETSGTGFFVHGMAWGIRAGLLDRREYEPAVRKGWIALARAVHADGKLGYVQRVSDRPDDVSVDDTQFYGVGAFLLAATAVADLDLRPGPDPTVEAPASVQVILNVREGGEKRDGVLYGGTFKPQQQMTVPADHSIHDGLFAFEGVGWESELVGYRLYLDERFAVDVFGKKTPARVLHSVGLGADDYHEPAPWGMDVFKVGDTVGFGGLGLLREGRAGQLKPGRIIVRVADNGPLQGTVQIVAEEFAGEDSKLAVHYSIRQASPVTRVRGGTSRSIDNLITGLPKHPGVRVLYGSRPRNGWTYVATWGPQSLTGDGLGLVLFYRAADMKSGPQESGDMIYVQFADAATIDYGFAAAWIQDRQGVSDITTFEAWITTRLNEIAVRL